MKVIKMKKINYLIKVFIVILLLFVGIYITSCGEEKTDDLYDAVIKDVKDKYELGETVTLNLSSGATYTIDKEGYLDENLKIITDDLFKDVQITLTINIKGKCYTKSFLIKQNKESLASMVFDYVESFLPKTYTASTINLPTEYNLDKSIKITYVSQSPEYLTNDGRRVAHEYDEEVTLTCTIDIEGKTSSKDFTVYSRGIDYKTRYKKALDYIDEFFETTELTEGTVLPTTLPLYGGRFRWLCDDPTVIYDYKTIHLPKEEKITHLFVEIMISSSIQEMVMYEVKLNARPAQVTDEVYAKTFYETVLSEVGDYFTIYNGTAPLITREKFIDEFEAINKEFYGLTRPSIPQETLDSLFYEGYTVKNKDNIIWIVVHETGVTYAGMDASAFADQQITTAFKNEARQVSWAYTVDDHSIYQSYEDYLPLWHATDGRTIGGGNQNGIGIEMCINNDGNFEETLFNNSRLMASLLIKHNMSMINMKRHHDFYETKACPQTLMGERRWYEYLTLIEREYISQSILKNMDISYSVDLEEQAVKDTFDASNVASGEIIPISITINGNTYIINATKR